MHADISAQLELGAKKFDDSILSAFHSCVGGCNGCINIGQDNNAGLDEALKPLEELYQKLGLADHRISRADFWAFAGLLAAEKGASLQTGYTL